MKTAVFVISLFSIASCQLNDKEELFTKISSEDLGIDFENVIQESPEINILNYEYTYNGGGVAAGDFNNDGFSDLYFTGNTVSNRLYLNLGNLKFKDITETARVAGRDLWKTGVTTVDVNGDGWLDIYVCYSGPELDQSFSNQLFINNGNDSAGEPTFTEQAEVYGLDAPGTFSTQAVFFDYDRDGDLDMFLINHGNHFYSPFINTNKLRTMRHPQFGNRLYRNDYDSIDSYPSFTEVSQEAGIHGGGLNFGLGVSISDINNDGWPDIFVTNDYEEQDFLYINNQDGTFSNTTKKSFGHLSRNGMGTDIADFNNDGKFDLMEVDMWPEDNFRQKLLKGPDDYYRYQLLLDSGFHHQQMRNTLQMNNGTLEDGTPVFSEVGQLSGVSATDWSWGPLFADYDNDGLQDIFITNGYLRDFTSMDFLKYTVEEEKRKANKEGKELELYSLVGRMPSTKTSDYIFKNNGDLTFENVTKEWGLDIPNLSFGATYVDLDNDGDLDLVSNNTNEPASIWINNSDRREANNYLKVKLTGSKLNTIGIGAKVYVEMEYGQQVREQYLTRGFQSSVDPTIHFGLGNNQIVKSLKVVWPDDKISVIESVKPNQLVHIDYKSARPDGISNMQVVQQFIDITKDGGITFVHQENKYVDYDREPLLPYQLSRLGPSLTSGDVNGDGTDDFYVGGASGQSGKLFIGVGDGTFYENESQPWNEDKICEDTGAVFFDVDGDGDLDLFVVSGGNEFLVGSTELDDRLYINLGNSLFKKSKDGSTVADHASGSCVTAADYDHDGDIDLYVGGRLLPGSFPVTTPGALLRNETNKKTGEVKFVVATTEVNADLREPGMVTDATWTDFNGDGWHDLLIVGEWMPIRLFENVNGKLVEVINPVLQNSNGMWSRIEAGDIDNDGDMDFVIGNAGNNLPWTVTSDNPLTLYYADFDADGRIDPVICYTQNSKQYPIASRDELFSQMTSLRKKFTTYAQYGNATIEDVLDPAQMAKAKALNIQNTQTSVLENLGNGDFKLIQLPVQAQISNVNGIIIHDFNNDDFLDILIAGNFYPYRTQFGPSDASNGLLLVNNGNKTFTPIEWEKSGFRAAGDVRNMKIIEGMHNSKYVLIARNNDKVSLFEFRP